MDYQRNIFSCWLRSNGNTWKKSRWENERGQSIFSLPPRVHCTLPPIHYAIDMTRAQCKAFNTCKVLYCIWWGERWWTVAIILLEAIFSISVSVVYCALFLHSLACECMMCMVCLFCIFVTAIICWAALYHGDENWLSRWFVLAPTEWTAIAP